MHFTSGNEMEALIQKFGLHKVLLNVLRVFKKISTSFGG